MNSAIISSTATEKMRIWIETSDKGQRFPWKATSLWLIESFKKLFFSHVMCMVLIWIVFGFNAASADIQIWSYTITHEGKQYPIEFNLFSILLMMLPVLGSLFFSRLLISTLELKSAQESPQEHISIRLNELLIFSFRHMPVAVLVSFLGAIAFMLGFVCLVVPGIFLLGAFSLVFPIMGEKGAGISALSDSWRVTKGSRMQVVLIYVVNSIGTNIAISLITWPIESKLLVTVLQSALAPVATFWAVGFLVVMYLKLKKTNDIKEISHS